MRAFCSAVNLVRNRFRAAAARCWEPRASSDSANVLCWWWCMAAAALSGITMRVGAGGSAATRSPRWWWPWWSGLSGPPLPASWWWCSCRSSPPPPGGSLRWKLRWQPQAEHWSASSDPSSPAGMNSPHPSVALPPMAAAWFFRHS
uniref:Uncharacterized protein n=1 Tax=Arundo donax TaxID=35708 RepID=A0A0A9GEK5_ARUDO